MKRDMVATDLEHMNYSAMEREQNPWYLTMEHLHHCEVCAGEGGEHLTLSLSPSSSTAASQNNHMVHTSQAAAAVDTMTLLLGLSSHPCARKTEKLLWAWPDWNYSPVLDTLGMAALFSSAQCPNESRTAQPCLTPQLPSHVCTSVILFQSD